MALFRWDSISDLTIPRGARQKSYGYHNDKKTEMGCAVKKKRKEKKPGITERKENEKQGLPRKSHILGIVSANVASFHFSK